MIWMKFAATIVLSCLLGATRGQYAQDFEMESKHDVCKVKCDCYTEVDKNVLECPKEDSRIRVSYSRYKQPINRTYIDISCFVDDEEYRNLPNVTIDNINIVKISSCELPRSASIMTVLNRLGVHNVVTLFINNARKEFRNKLIRQHLTGLSNLTRLTISSSYITEIPEDFFEDVPNITWLSLKMNKITTIKNVFSKLKNLDTLELGENNLHSIEDGTFENNSRLRILTLWTNNIQNLTKNAFRGIESLRILDLTNNQIETFEPDVFDLLPNLSEIYLNKNNFRELPSGLFKNNKKLKDFVLLYNQRSLKNLPSGFFANLNELNRVYMRCDLETLPSDLFSGSENLQHIDLSNNKLVSVPKEMLAGQKNLKTLHLSFNKLTKLEDGLFDGATALTELYLNNNNLTQLPRHIFNSLSNLETLYLNNNNLMTIPMDTFGNARSLKVIDMSHNVLTFMENQHEPFQLSSPFQIQTNLHHLNLSHNHIEKVFPDWMFNLIKLEHLDLSYNNINFITTNDLQFLSRKIQVYLTHNQITEIFFKDIEAMASDHNLSDNIEVPVLYLDGNPVVCDCLLTEFVRLVKNQLSSDVKKLIKIDPGKLTCSAPPEHAEKLVASVNPHDLYCDFDTDSSKIKKCPIGCKCQLRRTDYALVVNCSNAELTTVPVLPNPQTSSLNFTILYLENNYLTHLPKNTDLGYDRVRFLYAKSNNITNIAPENLPSQLELLDLRNNNMIHINETVLSAFNDTNTLKNISLSNNPWKCNCEALSFMIYIQSQFKKVNDYDNLECSDGQRINKMVPGDICTDDVQTIVALSITLALLGILIGILAALYYKYQQEIKIWMYWHNICPFIFNSDTLDANKKYDAFISYSHKDEDFVADTLVPELEFRRKFNLCIHRRDWTVGDFIPDQIIRSVADSRRTIIVLSPNYVESIWGTMEFRAAHHTAVKENVSRVIVIIYGDVNTQNMDSELKSYIDMNTYIKWGDPWFWERLHYALRTIKTGKKGAGAFFKTSSKSTVDDKLELIHPSPMTPPHATSPVDSPKLNGSISYARNGKLPNGGLNGHVNGAFIINTNSKQSDV